MKGFSLKLKGKMYEIVWFMALRLGQWRWTAMRWVCLIDVWCQFEGQQEKCRDLGIVETGTCQLISQEE